MAEKGEFQITVGEPESAIRLPIGIDDDLTMWAESTSRGRHGYEADEQDIADFAQELLDAAADSSARDVVMAYLLPDEVKPVELARIEIQDVNPDDSVPQVTLDWLEQIFSQPPVEQIAPVHVWRGELPAGPAIRVIRQLITDVDEFGDGRLMHSVVYAVRPPATDFAVVMTASWAAVIAGPELLGVTDLMAQTLQVLPAG